MKAHHRSFFTRIIVVIVNFSAPSSSSFSFAAQLVPEQSSWAI
jgi:hypothetical protein